MMKKSSSNVVEGLWGFLIGLLENNNDSFLHKKIIIQEIIIYDSMNRNTLQILSQYINKFNNTHYFNTWPVYLMSVVSEQLLIFIPGRTWI